MDRTILERRLRSTGLRLTPQRERVWHLLGESAAGLTLPAAASRLALEGVGQATVYRTVRALEALGLVKLVRQGNGDKRYVACSPGHNHLIVCKSCSRTVEFEECGMDTLERLVALKTGYQVQGHHLELFGLCPECQSNDKSTHVPA